MRQGSDIFRANVEAVFTRRLDIILEDGDGSEKWVELKSYKAQDSQGVGLTKLAALGGRYIDAWNLTTGTSKEMGLHRQFSLDRAAANVEHARLTLDKDRENQVVDVSSDFVWYFQKFKWTDKVNRNRVEISPRLGSPADSKTIYGGLIQPIDGGAGNGRRKDIYEANMGERINASAHIKYADLRAFLRNLGDAGFEEAVNALAAELVENSDL